MKKINFRTTKYLLPLMLIPFFAIMFLIINGFNTKEKPLSAAQSISDPSGGINAKIPRASDDIEPKDKVESLKEMLMVRRRNTPMADLEDENSNIGLINENGLGPIGENGQTQAYIDLINKRKQTRAAGEAQRDELLQLAKKKGAANKSNPPKNLNSRKQAEIGEFKRQFRIVDSISNPDKYAVKDSTTIKIPDNPAKKISKNGTDNSGLFYTIKANRDETLIKAILDEGIKVWQGSRVRIRLLEGIFIDQQYLETGTYLYGIVSSFANQRVNISVSSVVIQDEIIPLDISLYDNDGIEGIYVPDSSFRKFAKDVGQQTASGANYNSQNTPNSDTQILYQSVSSAVRSSTRAIQKALRKNKARLKYNTEIYLVNNN